jgi:hypothetical protein
MPKSVLHIQLDTCELLLLVGSLRSGIKCLFTVNHSYASVHPVTKIIWTYVTYHS